MTEMPPRPAQRAIAVCVDDFGLHAGINAAVLQLARQGRISATSCMVGAPAWSQGVGALRELAAAGTIDCGLHLDLTEHPLDAGLRRDVGDWIRRSLAGLAPRAALRRDIEAQLDAFEAAMGRPPVRIDGHQHVHQLPGVRDELLAALERRYPGSERPRLRSTRRPAGSGLGKPFVIESLGGRALARQASERGFAQNAHLLGVYGFDADAQHYRTLLQQWLRAAVAGDELMVHPATSAPPDDVIGPARLVEYGVLAGPEFGALLAAEGVAIRRAAQAS